MKRPSRRSAEFIPPNPRILLAVAVILLCALGALFLRKKHPDPTVSSNQPDISRQSSRAPRAAPDFWDSAIVPDPGERPPIATIRPEDLGITIPTTPVDPQALISKAISENNLPAIQSAALWWFQQDPTAARDWLATQSTFEDLQPAISYIANHISEKGDIKTAIEWVKLLPEGTLREDTLFDIHALALRTRQITTSEITPDGIPPERFQELLSGAAGD